MGGDLHHLWRVSEVHLPRIADVYYDANRAVAGLTASGALAGSVADSWDDLRAELQGMFAQVGDAVLAAADGVRLATRVYVDADQASADALAGYLADPANHDPASPESNPPVAGADDDPGLPVRPTA